MAISPKVLAQITANPCKAACDNRTEPCYAGHWTAHKPHHYEVIGMGTLRHLGKHMVHCPGK